MAKTATLTKPIELPRQNVASQPVTSEVSASVETNQPQSMPHCDDRVPDRQPLTFVDGSDDLNQVVHCPIRLAFSALPEASNSKRLSVGTFDFDIPQSRTFRELREGLRDTHAQLKNGRHVESQGDVIRYLLERIEETRSVM